jgi:hypothetical protein
MNSTKLLLEDSFGRSTNNNPYTMSAIQRKFDNTQNLLNEKTSILIENSLKLVSSNSSGGGANSIGKHEYEDKRKMHTDDFDDDDDEGGDDYLKTSYVLEETDNKIINKLSNIYQRKTDDFDPSLSLSDSDDNNLLANKGNLLQFNHSPKVLIDKTNFINFGLCFPGENLMKKIKIQNSSMKEKTVVEIKFSDRSNITQHFKDIIPGNLSNLVENSFEKYKCFQLSSHSDSNNDGQIFEKKILLKEKEELEVEIIMIAPFVKRKENVYGICEVYNNKELVLTLPLLATIEIPKLMCLKQLNSLEGGSPLITIKLDLKSKGQKFRIPFKNLSIKDMEIEFFLDKVKNNNIFTYNDNFYECQFLFFPKVLELQAQSTSSIDLIAKISKKKVDENLDDTKIYSKVRKVIIAKIKNSSVHYSFFVEAFF